VPQPLCAANVARKQDEKKAGFTLPQLRGHC